MELLSHAPVALFLFLLTIGTSILAFNEGSRIYEMFVLHPWAVTRQRRYYTMFSSALIHADGPHLIFNMISFYFFALPLEIYLGHWQFLALYVGSMPLSCLTTVARHRNDADYYCLGASGAVTAVIFSFIIFDPTTRIYFMFIPFGIPAPIYAVVYVAASYYLAKSQHATRINHEAHLWGAISGLAFTLVLQPAAFKRFAELLRGWIS